MPPMHPTLLRTTFWLFFTALTVASLVPVPLLPPQVMSIWDKAQHALGFATLGTLGLLAYPRHGPLRVLSALLLWGGLIELLQAWSGWRYGEWIDWLADGVGLAAAGLLWWLLPRQWTKRA